MAAGAMVWVALLLGAVPQKTVSAAPAASAASSALAEALEGPPVPDALRHSPQQAACEAHWGRELGPLLCPSMLGQSERDDAQVEVRLLAALWHLVRAHAAALSRASAQSARATWRALWPLLGEEPL